MTDHRAKVLTVRRLRRMILMPLMRAIWKAIEDHPDVQWQMHDFRDQMGGCFWLENYWPSEIVRHLTERMN